MQAAIIELTERPMSQTAVYLKEVAWVVLMVNLFIALGAFLIRPALGTTAALWLFGGLAAMVTLLFFGIVLMNLVLAGAIRAWQRMRARR
jgi:hypothetical protein